MIDLKRLYDFLFKNVNVVEKNGKVHSNWYVDTYSSEYDNEEGEESIGLMPSKESKVGIELFRSEIESINIA